MRCDNCGTLMVLDDPEDDDSDLHCPECGWPDFNFVDEEAE